MASIQVKNSAGSLLAIFDQEYVGQALDQQENQDIIKDPQISIRLNQECSLSFMVPITSSKLQYLTDQNFLYCDNREFVIMDPDSVKLVRDNGQLWATIEAKESWHLLEKQYTTICNDSTQLPVNDLDVVITRSGTISGGYAAGSAGSAISFLLAGTGWSIGTVDITGAHDIKNNQQSIGSTLRGLRDLWGGYHFWNSISHTLSHRPESYQPYNGYQIRLGKNLKKIIRSYDYDVTTKLWVFGQNDVDILNVNILNSGTCTAGGANTITLAVGASSIDNAYKDGWIYLTGGSGSGEYKRIIAYNGSTRVATVESNWTAAPTGGVTTYDLKARFLLNFSYGSSIKSDIYRDQEITDPNELKLKGQDVHTKLAYPRVNYRVEQVDLREISDFSHETFSAGDYIDIIDEYQAIAVQARVIYHRYNPFQPHICDLEIGSEVYQLNKLLSEIYNNNQVTYKQARTSGTVIVSDGSTTKNTQRADFIVPPGSVNAEVTINQAIQSLGPYGGKVVLLEGTFTISNQIILLSNITLEGQGANTIIKVKDSSGAMLNGIVYAGSKTNVAVLNLKIDGNKSSNINSIIGVYFNNVSLSYIKGVWTTNFTYDGISLIDCKKCIVMANFFDGNGRFGLEMFGTVQANSNNNSIIGNISRNNVVGIYSSVGSNNIINSNTCESNSQVGITLDTTVNSTLSGNTLQKNGYQGLVVLFSNSNIITQNNFMENSQGTNNTYDHIFVDQDSNYNSIQQNTCRRGALTNKARYGVRINQANCDGNIITNNDLYDSGTTASVSDAGTGTITTAGNRL